MNFERLVQRTAATLLMSMICLISLAQSRTVSGLCSIAEVILLLVLISE